jgi:anti-sigma regulatory factor (Ser/Thr protein kinase)
VNASTIGAATSRLPPPRIPSALAAVERHWSRREGLELDGHPSVVSRARKRIRDTLREWGLSDLADDVIMIGSELMANAVQSTRAEDGSEPVWLWLLASSTAVAVLVFDATTGVPRSGEAASDDESGRGLMIVDALSAQWGWDFPSLPHGGKVVWALIQITHTERTLESPMQQNALFAFERTNLEKLRLACQVILDQAEEKFVSDSLEAELYGLRDQIDLVLLLPERPAAVA